MKTRCFALILAILLVACKGAAPVQPAESGRYVVIDADMGKNSVMEILYLLQAEGVDVKAITVAGDGEAHCQPGMRTALGLLALTGNEDIPVACGREKPLKGDFTFPQIFRAGADNLAEILELPAGGEPSKMDAVALLTSVIEAAPNKATLFAEGPLTNLGEALQARPDLVDKIEMVYIMGGALEVPGNVEEQPSAEWNIYVDPYAANLVFASGAPVTLIPLDATNHAPATEHSFRAFEQNHSTPAAKVIYNLMRNNPSFYQSGENYFWDPLAAAILTDPSLGTIEALKVEVEESGAEIGRTRVSEQGSLIQAATSADSERFLELFLSVLNGGVAVELPAIEEVVKIGSFYISGKTCEYNGPSVIPAGRVSLDISAKPQEFDNGLIVADVDEGKGLEDLIARGNDNCLGPSPWSQPLGIYATTDKKEEQTELVFTVQEKSIFLLCTSCCEPCENFEILGPIEVK
ncbi:MAG: nucleoside hydrolase [Chloroflexota bacterium]|nr:MAG: nucleoside hydrolase [Chloroflexota bacterium]